METAAVIAPISQYGPRVGIWQYHLGCLWLCNLRLGLRSGQRREEVPDCRIGCGFFSYSRRVIDQDPPNTPRFFARRLRKGTNHGAVGAMLPAIDQPQIYQGLQPDIPDTLFSPTQKPDMNRVPFSVALMHVAPRTACAQNMQHAIEKQEVISSWTGPTSTFRRRERANDCPSSIRQIASCHECPPCALSHRLKVNQICDRPYEPADNVT